jgi:hypothetical protein
MGISPRNARRLTRLGVVPLPDHHVEPPRPISFAPYLPAVSFQACPNRCPTMNTTTSVMAFGTDSGRLVSSSSCPQDLMEVEEIRPTEDGEEWCS